MIFVRQGDGRSIDAALGGRIPTEPKEFIGSHVVEPGTYSVVEGNCRVSVPSRLRLCWIVGTGRAGEAYCPYDRA
jgi:hypothetical protein